MFPNLVQRLVELSKTKRSNLFKALSLLFGATVFLIIIPWVLIILLGMIRSPIGVYCPRSLQVVIGFISNALGLFLTFWSVASLWISGKGTPSPFAPPQHLVVDGPYKLCRNPIKLGVISYYLGVGTLYDSLTTGLICFVIGLVVGTFYHKFVEEKELLVRFGEEYEDYKKSTPFLFPRFDWQSSFETHTDDESSWPMT